MNGAKDKDNRRLYLPEFIGAKYREAVASQTHAQQSYNRGAKNKKLGFWLQVCFQKSARIWFESVPMLIYSHRTRKVVLNVLSKCSGNRPLRKTPGVQIYRQTKLKSKCHKCSQIRGHSFEDKLEN